MRSMCTSLALLLAAAGASVPVGEGVQPAMGDLEGTASLIEVEARRAPHRHLKDPPRQAVALQPPTRRLAQPALERRTFEEDVIATLGRIEEGVKKNQAGIKTNRAFIGLNADLADERLATYASKLKDVIEIVERGNELLGEDTEDLLEALRRLHIFIEEMR